MRWLAVVSLSLLAAVGLAFKTARAQGSTSPDLNQDGVINSLDFALLLKEDGEISALSFQELLASYAVQGSAYYGGAEAEWPGISGFQVIWSEQDDHVWLFGSGQVWQPAWAQWNPGPAMPSGLTFQDAWMDLNFQRIYMIGLNSSGVDFYRLNGENWSQVSSWNGNYTMARGDHRLILFWDDASQELQYTWDSGAWGWCENPYLLTDELDEPIEIQVMNVGAGGDYHDFYAVARSSTETKVWRLRLGSNHNCLSGLNFQPQTVPSARPGLNQISIFRSEWGPGPSGIAYLDNNGLVQGWPGASPQCARIWTTDGDQSWLVCQRPDNTFQIWDQRGNGEDFIDDGAVLSYSPTEEISASNLHSGQGVQLVSQNCTHVYPEDNLFQDPNPCGAVSPTPTPSPGSAGKVFLPIINKNWP